MCFCVCAPRLVNQAQLHEALAEVWMFFSQRLLKGFSRVQVERSSDLILPTGMIKRSKITQADCNIRMHLAKQAMFQGKDELLKRDSACIIAHISSQYR